MARILQTAAKEELLILLITNQPCDLTHDEEYKQHLLNYEQFAAAPMVAYVSNRILTNTGI